MYTIFLIPVLMILVGIIMFKYPPKKINFFVGYRNVNSMKDKERWDFSNKYCGKLFTIVGLIMLIVDSLLFLLFKLESVNYTENVLLIIVILQVGMILLSGLLVEKKVRNYKK